jgi:hypothetical protein
VPAHHFLERIDDLGQVCRLAVQHPKKRIVKDRDCSAHMFPVKCHQVQRKLEVVDFDAY